MSHASQRLSDAGYHTHAVKNRCDHCLHVGPSHLSILRTRHDRHCAVFDAEVKTHGTCTEHQTCEDADLPFDEFPGALAA